jgi:uncharacterized delta-60 repeat protein
MRRTILVSAPLAVALAVFMAATALAAPGDLDATFGGDGIVTTNFTRRVDSALAMAIQTDGKLVVAGGSGYLDGRNGRFAIARYSVDGSLDATFGADGKVTTNFSRYGDDAAGVAIQNDGKIVVAGDARLGSGNSAFGVARYNTDGSLDTTFGGGDGKVLTQFTPKNDGVSNLAIQLDGKILVSGGTGFDARVSKLALARYTTDGSLDATFGGDGKVTLDLSEGADFANAVVAQPDGKIVAGGRTVAGEGQVRFVLVRFNADGTLDDTFGTGGVVTTAMTKRYSNVEGLVLQPDMKIVAAGFAVRAHDRAVFALARYDSDGSLDDTFGGGDGKTLTDFTPGEDYGLGLVLQADGQIVVAGVAGADSDGAFALARYQADGSLDTTFGGNGTVTTNLTAGYDASRGIVVQTDGNIVTSGGAGSKFGIVRYIGA